MRLFAVLSCLALLGRARSAGSASVPADQRADPRDFREYLSPEGVDDASANFMAECLAQTFVDMPVIWQPAFRGIINECVRRGKRSSLAMKAPYMSDWARWLEFELFAVCLTQYMFSETVYSRWPVPKGSSERYKQHYAQTIRNGINHCHGTLPATIVHRPTLPVHEGAPVAEHRTSEPLQFRHAAARRAGLHPLAWFRRLGPALLREMRPAVRQAEATLETRPRLIE
ncbi:MAG: hypothetical protein M1826_004553 [Phylliscum demangeonii]|nr:MAG: hypothetical protein M1826_004553 [Phylliscum demangeonii]